MNFYIKVNLLFFISNIQCVTFGMENSCEYLRQRDCIRKTVDSINEVDTTELFGYPIKAIHEFHDDLYVMHRSTTLYSGGLIPLPTTTRFPSFNKEVHVGDTLVFDAHVNKKYNIACMPRSIKIPLGYRQSVSNAQFGQYEDTVSMIWIAQQARKAGVNRLTLDGICYGALREMMTVAILYLMKHPELFNKIDGNAFQKYDALFTRLGITSPDCHDILSMINGVLMQAPLKEVCDVVECTVDPAIRMGITSAAATSTIISGYSFNYNPMASLITFGASMVAYVQQNKWISPVINGTTHYLTNKVVPKISLYKSDELSIYDLYECINNAGFAQTYPHISFFITTQHKDPFVGGDIQKIVQLMQCLPKATIMPSCASNHTEEDERQIITRNACREECGATYTNHPARLKSGKFWLNLVRSKIQEIGLEAAIRFMETPESYDQDIVD